MRLRASLLVTVLVLLGENLSAQTSLRKIGELELGVQGITATVQPANPTIPKNTPAGVRIVVNTPSGPLTSSDVAKFLGGNFEVHGELSGPGLVGTVTLPVADPSGGTPIVDPLLLPIPALSQSGDYTLSNLRITLNGAPALDVSPATILVKVIDQVLITSVETRPLTLDEIKAAGIVLDSNDFLGFQFTIGLALQSNATTISFPVVFDRNGVPIPQPLIPPSPPSRDSVPIPTIVPVLLTLTDANGNTVDGNDIKLPNGSPAPVKIPSVLVIPGDIGFLKQFFSAQLFVANGAPAGSGLVVHDINGTINLPPGDDGVGGTADDPLSLPNTNDGPEPPTKAVRAVGPDGKPGTADDVDRLNPADQGQAEFILRGEKEGFHKISFNIQGVLDGLATGPVNVTGLAQGGVLVRNPFFDLTFAVPAIVRNGEQFKVYITVKNLSQSVANAVTLTLDSSRLSGATLVGDPTQMINTIPGGGATTLTYLFKSLRSGQVVATYLHFDTTDGSTGNLKFTLGVGERGIPLSPDTLVLPASVQNLPKDVVDAAMLVLGEGWSIATAPAGTLPSSVIRTSKAVVTQKALALAEAGLRVGLGLPMENALRDLLADFYGGSPLDPGFDQLLRTTQAGQDFERAVGAAIAQAIAGSEGALSFQNDLSNVFASGPDFVALSIASGMAAAPVNFTLTDGNGKLAQNLGSTPFSNDVSGFAQVPLGSTDSSPILGLLTTPAAYPYTVQLIGTASGTVDLAVTMPHGDGSFIRGEIDAVTVTPGLRARIVLDASQPNRLVLEQDTNNDGTFITQTPLNTTIISAQGPRLVSATIIGPDTLPGASPLGVQMLLLFDRMVLGSSAQQLSQYQIPDNAVLQAATQLSGRVVLANLQQPEGPYVPSTASVSNIADLRGAIGASGTVPLQSRLSDPGAVVSGRVFNADGTPVSTATVTYSTVPPSDCSSEAKELPVGVSNIPVTADGRYEFRYVRQDSCGLSFQISTQDPNTGALRQLSNFVRIPGQRLIMDIPILGRGSVTGIVRDLSGNPVPGAAVTVLSQTDLQIGARTVTDGSGSYAISGVTVGPVSVQAAKGTSLGRSAGNIPRAGNTATVDVNLDSGQLSVSGSLQKQENGVLSPVPNWPVVYSVVDSIAAVPVGVVNTDAAGNFNFSSVPTGNFIISAQLTATDRGSITGFAVANQNLTNQNITIVINTATQGIVNGTVTLPDHSPASGVVVYSGTTGVVTGPDGSYSLPGLPVRSGSQTISAQTRDGLRSGSTAVSITVPGQIVNNANIVLSGLGSAQFSVLDSNGKPVANQSVALLSGSCPFACGCDPKTTSSDGVVTFTGLPVGQINAVAISSGFDVTRSSASIIADGTTGFGVLRFAGSGSVTGNVLGPDGKPVFGADIMLSSNVFDQDSCSLVQGLSQRIQTDLNGNFHFNNVKVGRVGVNASQVFFPTQVGAQGAISAAGQTVDFNLKLVNTISGVLSGTVFLPDGLTPAGPGVEITANGPLPDVTVVTDANSHFQFAKIFPEGTYRITARDPITGGVVQDTLFLRAEQDMVHDLRLKGRGTVTVQVVDGSNQPVDSAFVRLTETTFPNSVREDAVQPANQGQVTFEQVFQGPFTVEVSDTLGRGGRASSVLPNPEDTVNVVVQLTTTGTVQGHFRMPDSTVIPFGAVRLLSNGRQIGQITTDGDADPGAFVFTFVPAGPVTLEAQDPVTARTGVAAGSISTDRQVLTLDVVAQGLGTVTGFVTTNGAPQPGATVDVFSGSYHATTVSDSTGQYLISGVPEGHIVSNASLQNGFLAGTASASLVGDGTQLNLDVALRGSGELTGQVLQADGVTPASASLVTVHVGGVGGGTQSVTTDSAGNFAFPIVPAGTASITVTVLGSIDQAQTSLEILSGTTVQTSIRLNGIGSITGHALDSTGNPISGHLTITGTGAFPYSFVLDSSTDGSFFLPQVLAGTFTATLSSQVGGFTLFGSTSSSVLPGRNNDLTVQLQPSGTVLGTVLRPDGVKPAPGANVTLTLAGGGSIIVQSQTDGTFTAEGVPLSAFTVRVNDPVSTGQALVQGFSVTTNGETVNLGNIVLNDTTMAVVSIDPGDGSTGVPLTQPIKIAFTNPLQSLSGISIAANGSSLFLTSSLSTDGKLATFTGTLPDSSQIAVTVSSAVSDIYGRHPAQTTTATFQTVDVTPPSVLSVLPAAGTIQVPGNTTITVNFSEPLSASASLTDLIVVSGPGGVISGSTVLAAPKQAVFTPAADLPANGSFNVAVNHATDLSGNVQTSAYNFTIFTLDTVAPAVQLVQPPGGGFTTSARPSISFNATDALTGVNISTAAITLDGQQVTTGTLNFTPAINLTEGTHTASASVADRAGNVGSGSGSFIIDTQPPSPAAISGISEGQVLKGIVPISLSATDATSGVAMIDLLVDGNVLAHTTSPFQLSLNSATIADGNHTLTARATDVAGNVGTAGTAVHVVVDNVSLAVSFTSPAAGASFNNQFTTTATTNKATQRIDFTFAGQVISSTSSPFTATFSVATVQEGSQTITAQAFDFAGNSASATRTIVVDPTAPAIPNVSLINAEPPVGGFSQVHGLVGSVEGFATLQITNVTHPASATASVNSDGTFSTNIAGSVDDTLSLVAVDAAGNHSQAALITVRTTSSLPPTTGSTGLNYAGDLIDRVGTTGGALAPDGSLDAVFTVSLNIGSNATRTLSRIDLSNGSATHSAAAGSVPIGVSSDAASPFLNRADGSISINITSGATLTLITPDNGFMQPGLTYTVTAFFTDGSKFVGTFLLVALDDRPLVAHSATITANPPMVTSSSTTPGTSIITITNIRDINGTLIPDGNNIALSATNGASHNGFGDAIPSAGGTILDGVPAANNVNFKIFTILGGTVTATYSSQSINPSALTGTIAVIQMQAADSAGNVLGTEVVGTQDINVRAVTDRVISGGTPASIYADTADHRSHMTAQVRDAQGHPVPDGTKIAVSAANNAAVIGCCFAGSIGGTIVGGIPSPSGAQYRIFTTTGGSFQFDYSDSGMAVGVHQTSTTLITFMNVNTDNTVNVAAIGTANVTLVGAANAEMSASMNPVQLISPSVPVTIDIHHVHDARGNLVPDGANVLVTANNNGTVVGCCFIGSAGGSITDGLQSPNAGFRYYTLQSNGAAATYTVDGVNLLGPNSTTISNVQLAMGNPAGGLVDSRAIKLLPLTLVSPTNAIGSAQPATILGDGFIHTSTVTFNSILDAFGNPIPDGVKVAVTAINNGTVVGCCFLGSAGGQILSGTPSPSNANFMVHTISNGQIVVTYADQNVISGPGQINTAQVGMVEAASNGTIPSITALATTPIRIAGVTSATVVASPNFVFADGGDHRTMVTVTNIRDASGNPVPDGTLIAATALNNGSVVGCCFLGSAGGVIIGGTPSSFSSAFQTFTVTNGQVVFQYSSQGVTVPSGQRTANVQIVSLNSSGGEISALAIGVAAIQLLSPASATVSLNPSDIFSDGFAHTSAITITNVKQSDNVTPVPDGTRLGLSAINNASTFGCCFVGSAGGQILSAGAVAADDTPATGNGNFGLFTISGGQALANYSDTGVLTGISQTQTANIQVVGAAVDGTIPTIADIAVAPIFLHGISSATGNGPTTLSKSAGTVTVTFSGIKDSAGHLVPDGTLVAASAANSATVSGCCFVSSSGGTIVDGSPSPSGDTWRVFSVQNGSITLTYSAATAGVGTARIQITGTRTDGSVFSSTALNGGVWAINITN